jgi:DNA-binding NtrC family response regulator
MAYVLVVDDEAAIREVLGRRLQNWGHQVVTADSAPAALDEMERAPAEIVMCDVTMPVHDGLWLLPQLRDRWPETVVIMVTGATDPRTVMNVKALGAVDYVAKPIGREMLHQALQRALAVLESRTAGGDRGR